MRLVKLLLIAMSFHTVVWCSGTSINWRESDNEFYQFSAQMTTAEIIERFVCQGDIRVVKIQPTTPERRMASNSFDNKTVSANMKNVAKDSKKQHVVLHQQEADLDF